MPPPNPFVRDANVDEPGMIGARWWHESMAAPIDRRKAVGVLVGVSGALMALGMMAGLVAVATSGGDDDDTELATRKALDLQREYGWSFGAHDEKLVFDGTSTQPFDRASLASLPSVFEPKRADLRPFAIPTLLESPAAFPKSTIAGDTTTFVPLRDALVPVSHARTLDAFERGRALGKRLAGRADVGVVVDLPGDEAVAFAAGAANDMEPVLLVDNWPHPRGVVPAHLALGSIAYYQPLFAKAKEGRAPTAAPLFVLEAKRLATYTDDSTQFDNRHLARMPSAEALTQRGVRRLVYITRSPTLAEADDLNDDFVSYSASGIVLDALGPAGVPALPGTAASSGAVPSGAVPSGATAWRPASPAPTASARAPAPPGSSAGAPTPPAPASDPLAGLSVVRLTPRPRSTVYSSGVAKGVRPAPLSFGVVPVVLAAGTGVLLGAKLSRSGTWNRAYGSGGG
jgi:hypothetical protein